MANVQDKEAHRLPIQTWDTHSKMEKKNKREIFSSSGYATHTLTQFHLNMQWNHFLYLSMFVLSS